MCMRIKNGPFVFFNVNYTNAITHNLRGVCEKYRGDRWSNVRHGNKYWESILCLFVQSQGLKMPRGMKCDMSTYDWLVAWVLLKKTSHLPAEEKSKNKTCTKEWKFICLSLSKWVNTVLIKPLHVNLNSFKVHVVSRRLKSSLKFISKAHLSVDGLFASVWSQGSAPHIKLLLLLILRAYMSISDPLGGSNATPVVNINQKNKSS